MNATHDGSSLSAAVKPLPAPRKRRRRHLPAKGLSRIWWAAYKQWQRVKKLAEADPFLQPAAEALDKAQKEIHLLQERRELAEAQAADAKLPAEQRVCWELFGPSTGWLPGDSYTRTAHTMTTRYSTIAPSVRPAAPGDAWRDLEQELKWHPLDVAKFDAHCEEVMRRYREWVSQGGAEKEAA